jgi:Flp pilus assembly protein TadG
MRWRRQHGPGTHHDERGQSAIEFAFVLPFVFLIIFVAAEATSILKTWMVLENASREGARYAAVRKTAVEVCTQTKAKGGDTLSGLPCSSCGSGASICVTNAQGVPGADTSVAISYVYTYKTPIVPLVSYFTGGIVSNKLPLNAHTVMRLE